MASPRERSVKATAVVVAFLAGCVPSPTSGPEPETLAASEPYITQTVGPRTKKDGVYTRDLLDSLPTRYNHFTRAVAVANGLPNGLGEAEEKKRKAREAALLVSQLRHGPGRDWYIHAAAKGDVSAMYTLGGLLAKTDPQGAQHWWEEAAAKGNVNAMVELGLQLKDRDPDAAFSLYERAASNGDTDAMYLAGILQITRDKADAARWWKLAASHGHTDTMLLMARLLAETDPVAASYWRGRATSTYGINWMADRGIGSSLLTFRPTVTPGRYEKREIKGLSAAGLRLLERDQARFATDSSKRPRSEVVTKNPEVSEQ